MIPVAGIKPATFLFSLPPRTHRHHLRHLVASSAQEIWPPARRLLDEALSLNEEDENLLPNQMSHDCLKERAYFKSAFLVRGAYEGPRPERFYPLIPFLETLHNSHSLNIKY